MRRGASCAAPSIPRSACWRARRTSSSTSRRRIITPRSSATIRRCSRRSAHESPRGAGSRSAACGSSPTPTCRPANCWCGNCSTASAISSGHSGRARACAGCPTASASRRLCRNCCDRPTSTASSPSRSIGRRRTVSRTTCSGGRASTARACWRTCSTTRSPVTTASCGPTGRRRLGAISAARTATTRRCSPSATATAAAG